MSVLHSTIVRLSAKSDWKTASVKPSDRMLRQAESMLGLVFPADYRAFIAELGFAHWEGGTVFGIDESKWSCVKATQDERARTLPPKFSPLPRACIVVARYPGGGVYGLWCDGARGRVSLFTDSNWGQEEEFWTGFCEWLDYEARI